MFKRLLKKLYFRLVVNPVRLQYEDSWHFSYRKDVLKYYLVEFNRKLSGDEKKVIRFLQNNKIHYFPYPFIYKYNSENTKVFFDGPKDLKYVIHEGKKLYFKKSWNENKIKQAYNFLLIEQDPESPHRYLTESFNVNEEDIVLDIGTAEGNFSLSIIEKAKKVYLFESDKEWIEALKATFEPWEEKIVIINKFVSDHDSDTTISLDGFIKEKVNFIKSDVEGEEIRLFKGAMEIIKKYYPKLTICTYHKNNDAENIKNYLKMVEYDFHFSDGWMIFLDDPTIPYLRKGLIRAERPCH